MRRGRQAAGPRPSRSPPLPERPLCTTIGVPRGGGGPLRASLLLLLLLALGSDNFEMAAFASFLLPFQDPFSFPKPLTHSTFASVSIQLFLQLFKVGPAIHGGTHGFGRQKIRMLLPVFFLRTGWLVPEMPLCLHSQLSTLLAARITRWTPLCAVSRP